MIEVIRKVVEAEIKKMHIAEIGVVTSIFPHSSDSDKDNYECNVKLKYKDFELRKVPVATQHIGLANTPNIGDLVLVSFVNGDINSPVVVGRLYTDEDRPPVNKEEEVIYIPPYSKSSDLRRVHMEFPGGMLLSVTDDDVTVEAGKTTLTLNRDGDVQIESSANLNIQSQGDMSFSAKSITMDSELDTTFKAGTDIIMTCDKEAQIRGQTLVQINSKNATKIEGVNVEVYAQEDTLVTGLGRGVSIVGYNVAVNADSDVGISGNEVDIEGAINTTIKGAQVSIN